MPYVLSYQHALRAYFPKYQRAFGTYVLTCQRVLRVYLLACSRANVPCMVMCLRVNVPWVLWVPTCSRAKTTINENRISITYFPHIFVIVLCLFPVKLNCCTFLHFSYQSEAFNGCYNKFCTIKWFDFRLSTTLRVVLKWLIESEW